MNKVILIGRLVADPEVRNVGSDSTVSNFRIAVDRPFVSRNGEREADFFNVVTWNKLAEVVGRNLSKGRLVGVSGRLQTRSYDDKDGIKRYVTEVIADSVEFLDSKHKADQPEEESDTIPYDPVADGVPF